MVVSKQRVGKSSSFTSSFSPSMFHMPLMCKVENKIIITLGVFTRWNRCRVEGVVQFRDWRIVILYCRIVATVSSVKDSAIRVFGSV